MEWISFLVMLIIVTALVICLNRTYPMLRDDPTRETADRKVASYSLARVQMAFWTILVAASLFWLLGLWVYERLTGGSAAVFQGSLDIHVVALLGISGATGIASAAVDAQKDSMVEAAAASVRAGARARVNLSRQIAVMLPRVAGPNKLTGVSAALAQQSIQSLREQRSNCANAMTPASVVVERNRRTADHKSFLSDILVDENGNSLHRLQIVLFTLVYGLYFVVTVAANKTCLVPLSDQALALMGISSLVYVGFKIPGRSSTTPAPSQAIAQAVAANADYKPAP